MKEVYESLRTLMAVVHYLYLVYYFSFNLYYQFMSLCIYIARDVLNKARYSLFIVKPKTLYVLPITSYSLVLYDDSDQI